MPIRPFLPGDAPALRATFHSFIHPLARQHYTTAQLQAWAPAEYDATQWAERLRANRPWVAEVDGCIALKVLPTCNLRATSTRFLWRANVPGAAWPGVDGADSQRGAAGGNAWSGCGPM